MKIKFKDYNHGDTLSVVPECHPKHGKGDCDGYDRENDVDDVWYCECPCHDIGSHTEGLKTLSDFEKFHKRIWKTGKVNV